MIKVASRAVKVTIVNQTPFSFVRNDAQLYDFGDWSHLPDDVVPSPFPFPFPFCCLTYSPIFIPPSSLFILCLFLFLWVISHYFSCLLFPASILSCSPLFLFRSLLEVSRSSVRKHHRSWQVPRATVAISSSIALPDRSPRRLFLHKSVLLLLLILLLLLPSPSPPLLLAPLLFFSYSES